MQMLSIRKISISFLLFALISHLSFSQQTEKPDFRILLHGSSLLITDKNSSFLYGTDTNAKLNINGSALTFNAGYDFFTSDLPQINGNAHFFYTSAQYESNKISVSGAFFGDYAPEKIKLNLGGLVFNQKNCIGLGGNTSFEYNFNSDYSTKLDLFGFSQNQKDGDYLAFFGTIDFPFITGTRLTLKMPFDFSAGFAGGYSSILFQNSENEQNGNGDAAAFSLFAEKNFSFERHFFNFSAFYAFALANAYLTTNDSEQNYFLFPFTYLHFDASLFAQITGFFANYEYDYSAFRLNASLGYAVTPYFYYYTFIKYTYKDSLIWDGSVVRETKNDESWFSNHLIFAKIRASLNWSFGKNAKKSASVYLQKTLGAPIFTQKETSSESEFISTIIKKSDSLTENWAFTILLSGITFAGQLQF